LVNHPATLTAAFYGADEETAVDAGDVTVTVSGSDGTQLATGPGVPVDGSTGVYTFPFTPTSLDVITAEFVAASQTVQAAAEVVGGFVFSLPDFRAMDSNLTAVKYPAAKCQAAREYVETRFEQITRRSFTPRGYTEVVYGDGTDELFLAHPDVSDVVACTIDGITVTPTVHRDEYSQALVREDDVWPAGSEIVLSYTYGFVEVPADVNYSAKVYARYLLTMVNAAVDPRMTQLRIPDFGDRSGGAATVNISTPARNDMTGLPDVDAVLETYVLPVGPT
jgi:hypothetical protein